MSAARPTVEAVAAPQDDGQETGSERPFRKTPAARHIPALDGLRGLAVLMVFLYHYGGGRHSPNALLRGVGFACSLGWTGVTLFFLLSGFLITGILWDSKGERHWFRNFYVRRALRILPLYYGTLLLLLLWPLVDHRFHFLPVAEVVRIHALYLQNLPISNYLWKLVPIPFWLEHYWTLAVEEQFYLLWPWLLALVKTRRQGLALCFGVFLFSTLFNLHNQISETNPAAYWHSLQGHAGELAFGGALALLYRGRQWSMVLRTMQAVGLLAGVVFLAGMYHLRGPDRNTFFVNTFGLTAITLAFAGFLASLLRPGRLQRAASIGWLRSLGKISFGAYIFHLLPVYAYNRLTTLFTGHSFDTVFNLARMLIVAPITLGLAALSYRFYESRFLRLKSRLAPHRP